MRSFTLLPLFIFSLIELTGQATLKDFKFQMGAGPTLYFGQGHEAWGWSIEPSIKVGDSGKSSHFVGLEIGYQGNEESTTFHGHRLDFDQQELLLLINYTWFTPSIASGHVQPYLGLGAGNLFVMHDANSPTLGTLLNDTDSINLSFALDVGSEFLINQHFGFSLGYRFLSSFDVKVESASDHIYQHGVQLGALFAF